MRLVSIFSSFSHKKKKITCIFPNYAGICPLNIRVQVFYVYVFGSCQTIQQFKSYILCQLLLNKNAFRQFQKMSTTLSAHAVSPLHLSRSIVWGVGNWRGVMSWESTEPVIMDKHLAPFPPERLQWPQPNHCLLKHLSLLAHTTKSTISPCLPLPPWSARRNMLPSLTLTDEKQILRRHPHYLTGCKLLGEFKLVIHAPPKPRLGQS